MIALVMSDRHEILGFGSVRLERATMFCDLRAITLVSFVLILCLSTTGASYPYKTDYFDQIIDHYNFASHDNKTFKQRYMVSEKDWKVRKGPIFFYTGNEGPITTFLENTGFMYDIAPEFNALLVFAEHRFYGESLPFGNQSFTTENMGLLTVEQALADYATLIMYLKESLKCPACKVVTFGGSYGGMLSAYMRFKFPNIVDGAIASSAPIYSTAGLGSQTYFFDDVTKAFESVPSTGPNCVASVRKAFIQINKLADEGKEGLSNISSTFKLCKPLTDKTQIPHLQGWVRNAFTSMAMGNYPYNATFLGQMPAWPVNVSCGLIVDAPSTNPMQGLANAAFLFYNGTQGKLKCMDINTEFVECADPTGCGLGDNAKAWDWQACTEVTLPAGSNNVTDMFPSLPFNEKTREAYCSLKWKVAPKPTWLNVMMWGKDIESASNIVFCNGALDPWRGGGVLVNPNPANLDVCLIYEGAHHLDLSSNEMETDISSDGAKTASATIKELFVVHSFPGLSNISSTFKLCKTLTYKTQIPHLQGWVRNAFTNMAMANYPYNTTFLGQMPAWPVNVSCSLIVDAPSTNPMQGLANAAILFYNGTSGKLKCMDIDTEYVECADPTGCGLGNDAKAQDWQVCTEVTMPAGSNNVTDMFPALPFNEKMRQAYCSMKWKVAPKPTWLNVMMWGKDIKSASNIVFCNGALDPWRGGGVLVNPNPANLDVCLIYEGAHHLDLRGANPADPVYVQNARNLHRQRISCWIME
ncbi:dipeptidyl peptidase 2-like [Patiria miniata]|uniref:Uncharacterized protein n=1 Tax=Patiria miniata TaxID=46514 RepID=A0A914AKF3_PATMI|nr:dipeptidyl peptidase 2-like [Patiria miniata]